MGSSSPMFDVLGIGIATVDDVVLVPDFPAPDSKIRVRDRFRTCGGLCATALVAAARLGARVAYAGVLGLDEDSDFVLRSLGAEGIDTTAVTRLADGGPGRSIIVVNDDGKRVVLSDPRRTIAGREVLPSPELVRRARVLLVDHVRLPASLGAARVAHEAGLPVVGDLERDEDPSFRELLALIDHVVVGRTFGQHLTGEDLPSAIVESLRGRGRSVVVTDGAAGAWFVGPDTGDPVEHRPAFDVPVVDTTGCGDAFHGAYAAGLAAGLDLGDRVRSASAVGALAATAFGAQGGLPDRRTLDAFLDEHPD